MLPASLEQRFTPSRREREPLARAMRPSTPLRPFLRRGCRPRLASTPGSISMSREINGAVVVITGASSGIGRATAVSFAEQGAHVVLAARRERALEDVAAACEQAGGSALVVPTDVT